MNPWAAGLLGAATVAAGAAALALTNKDNRKKVNDALNKAKNNLNQKGSEVKKTAASKVSELASHAKSTAENIEKKAGEMAAAGADTTEDVAAKAESAAQKAKIKVRNIEDNPQDNIPSES